MTELRLLTLDILEKLGPILLDQPPGKAKGACPLTNGSPGSHVLLLLLHGELCTVFLDEGLTIPVLC